MTLAEMIFDGLLNFGDSVVYLAEIPASRYCDVSLSSLLFQQIRTMLFQHLPYVSHSRCSENKMKGKISVDFQTMSTGNIRGGASLD